MGINPQIYAHLVYDFSELVGRRRCGLHRVRQNYNNVQKGRQNIKKVNKILWGNWFHMQFLSNFSNDQIVWKSIC